jgi:hypothetical protein
LKVWILLSEKNYLSVDLEEALRPFNFCELDFINPGWPEAMAILNVALMRF